MMAFSKQSVYNLLCEGYCDCAQHYTCVESYDVNVCFLCNAISVLHFNI
jgi:hypothetical protein